MIWSDADRHRQLLQTTSSSLLDTAKAKGYHARTDRSQVHRLDTTFAIGYLSYNPEIAVSFVEWDGSVLI